MTESQSVSDQLEQVEAKFKGKWKLNRSENFEAFLQEMGAPYLARKAASFSKPECQITIVDGKVRIHTTTMMMTQDDTMDLGQEYEKDVMRTKMKVKAKFEDGKLIQVLTAVDGSRKPVTQTRDIVNDEMVLTVEVGDIVAKRIFARVSDD